MPELLPNSMPNASEQRVINDTIYKTTQVMKSVGAVEVSEVGPNEAQSGPEKWTVCARAIFAGELRYYTFFVKRNSVVDQRASVLSDRCEARGYAPLSQPR